MDKYLEFLRSKIEVAPVSGFDVDPAKLHPNLKPHQRDAVGYLKAEEENLEPPTLFDMMGGS